MARRRVEGFVESTLLVDEEPHRLVLFPSVFLDTAQLVKVPEEVLVDAGVDLEGLKQGARPIVEADVNLDATAPGFVNPIHFESKGVLPILDEECIIWE